MQAESIRCRENDDDEEGSDDENGEEDEDGDEDEEGEDDDDDEDEDEDEEERSAEQGNRDVEMANGDDEAGKSLPSASSALLCLALPCSKYFVLPRLIPSISMVSAQVCASSTCST